MASKAQISTPHASSTWLPVAARLYRHRLHLALLIACAASYLLLNALRLPFNMADVVHSSDGVQLAKYHESIFLPFIYDFGSKGPPQVRTTIQGVELEMPVDTGSTGVLISAEMLPDVDPAAGTPAYEFLTSSHILYNGRLVDLPITFHGSGGACATANVPVLVVDRSWICPWYDPKMDTFECPPGPNGEEPKERTKKTITYMGIGFGRNKPGDGQPNAFPRNNPFLNIESINGELLAPGAMWTGYKMSTKGVRLGLTEKNTQNFVFTSLGPGVTHDEDSRDWAMPEMCFSIDGKTGCCGSALIDTGIRQMYIRAEEGVDIPIITIRNPNKNGTAKWVRRVKPGTKIAVGFPSLNSSMVAGYSFSVDEHSSTMEPSYVVPGKEGYPPFINTGRNFLYGYSIAFDAEGGRFGFRPVKASSSL